MQTFREVSFPSYDFLFDLFVTDDRLEFEKKYNPQETHRYAVASALGAILNNARYSPEITYATMERILSESSGRAAILSAHGMTVSGIWCYSDGKGLGFVQDWIDEHDNGDYGALLIHSCNESGVRPFIERTPLFYAEGLVGVIQEYRTVLLEPPKTS